MAKPRDKRTKEQLLDQLAVLTLALDTVQTEASVNWGLVLERDEQLADTRRRLDSANKSRSEMLVRLGYIEDDVRMLNDELQRVRRELRDAKSSAAIMYGTLYKEVDGRAREQVLLKALMATLATLPVHLAVDAVRNGAEDAHVDTEVALEVFDNYFRSDVVEKAEREATTPVSSAEMFETGRGTGAEDRLSLHMQDIAAAGIRGVKAEMSEEDLARFFTEIPF